jgi:quinol monooxygenase YgiN
VYGTIAKMRVKPGKEEELRETMGVEGRDTPGFVFAHVYRMDDDPQTLMLAVAFDSRESYRANAESPEQNAEYEAYRALLEEDPEWHDGEILFSEVQQGQAAASD